MRKTASEIIAESLEKEAGVEYGWSASKHPDFLEKYPQLLDDYNGDDYNDDEIINRTISPMEYGYPYWNEKAVASLPMQPGAKSEALARIMNGDKIVNNSILISNPYDGEKGGGNFVTDKDGAKEVLEAYDELLKDLAPSKRNFDGDKLSDLYKKMQLEYSKNREDEKKTLTPEVLNLRKEYLDTSNQRDNVRKELDTAKKPAFFRFKKVKEFKNNQKNLTNRFDELNTRSAALSNKYSNIVSSYDKTHLDNARNYKKQLEALSEGGTDEDAVRLQAEALRKSLNDKSITGYKFGWY